MTNAKPKGKDPSLIGATNGRPERTLAQRQTKCKRCKAVIPARTACYQIPRPASGFVNKPRYCLACYQRILAQTKKDFDALDEALQRDLQPV